MNETKRISEVGLKLELDDYLSNAERFKALDENVLPLELDHLKDSYQHVLQRLAKACHQAVKFQHLAEKYRDQISFEIQAIANYEKEIGEFQHACFLEQEKAKAAAQEIRNYNVEFFNFLKTQKECPRDILLAFQAFLQLGPEGTTGDISWNAIRSLLGEKDKLANMMNHLFDGRLKDITRAEIEKVTETMRHLTREYSLNQPLQCQPLAKIMAKYVLACLSYWDMQEAIQARQEMQQLKKDKMDYIKKEMHAYDQITNLFEREIDAIYAKYQNSKGEYEKIKKEAEKADEALHKFEEHYKEIERERNRDHRNVKRIESLMQEMRKDCEEFDSLRVRLRYRLPADVEQA